MLKKILGGIIAAAVSATPVLAAPITLKLNSPAPPPSFLHGKVFKPWIEQVEKDSKGTLKIQLYVGGTLGNFKINYDRVVDGVADIGFILTSFANGKFKKLDVAELPFQSKNSTEASSALWNIYAKGLADDEFDKVKPLAIWTFPNAGLHTKPKISTIDDVKGLKIVTSNVSTTKIVELLGGVPVTFTPADTYQAISRGIAVGALMPFTGMKIFKLDEVTSNHLDVQLGSSTAMLFINKKKYDSLPAEAKAALDKHSGLALSLVAGKAADADWARSRKSVDASTHTLSSDEEKKWIAATHPTIIDWVSKNPDGENILKVFEGGIRDFRSGKTNAK